MTPAERFELIKIPVAMLGRAADQTPAKQWRRWGRGGQWTDGTLPPRIAVAVGAWSHPRYMAADATTSKRVWRTPDNWQSPGFYPTPGSPTETKPATIPWNPKWTPASGDDRGMLIDRSDGSGIELLGLRAPWPWEEFLLGLGTGGRYQTGDLIAGGVAFRPADPASASYDFRGSGGPKRWGMVTAEEIQSGDVGHCMALTGLTRWGAGAGWVPPATRREHDSRPPGFPAASVANDARLAVGGLRLALPISDLEIEAWADRRGHTGVTRRTATTLVRGLRDWGVHEAESGRSDPQIETTREGFAALGVTTANEGTLLDGLPWERLFVVAVPS